jgi:hypothetical protein
MPVLTETTVPKTSETIWIGLQVLHTPVPTEETTVQQNMRNNMESSKVPVYYACPKRRNLEKYGYISELLLVVEFTQLYCFD